MWRRATFGLDAEHVACESLLPYGEAGATETSQRLGPGEGCVGAAGDEVPQTTRQAQSREDAVEDEVGHHDEVPDKSGIFFLQPLCPLLQRLHRAEEQPVVTQPRVDRVKKFVELPDAVQRLEVDYA